MSDTLNTPLTRRSFASLAAGGVVFLMGCGSGGSGGGSGTSRSAGTTSAEAPGTGKTIGLSLNGLAEFDLAIVTGVLKELEDTGYRLVVRQANFDSSQELRNLEDLVAQRVDGLLVLPNTIQSATRGVLAAKSAGIPAVNQFWTVPTPADSGYIGVLKTNNVEGGRMIADYIRSRVPNGGEVLTVEGVPGQGFSEEFHKGIADALGPDYPIVASQPAFWARSRAITATQTMLTAHPDAKAIVSFAAVMGDGIANYLFESNRKDIVHVTSNADIETPKWLANGYIGASRYFSAAETGILSTRILRDYLENGTRPQEFVTYQPQVLVTRSDLAPNPARGVINPDLRGALGVFNYTQYMKQASKV